MESHKIMKVDKMDKSQSSATVFLSGLSEDTTNVALEDFASRIGPVRRCFVVCEKDNITCKGYGFVTFALKDDAKSAILSLKGNKFLGKTVNVEMALRRDRNEKRSKDETRITPPKSKAHGFQQFKKRFRIIARNIPFNVAKETVFGFFSQYGKIIDLEIPKHPKSDKNRGFVFVEYPTFSEAEKAINEGNDSTIDGRIIAVDWSLSRDKFESLAKTNNSNQALEGDVTGIVEAEEALPKRTSMSHVRKQPEVDVHKSTTLFLRNLDYNADSDDLKETFSEYGQTKFCNVVRDKLTKRSRGCAFVQFCDSDEEKARACATTVIQRAESFPGISIHGRKVSVAVAVDREKAKVLGDRESKVRKMSRRGDVSGLKTQATSKTDDVRNLSLIDEGTPRNATEQSRKIKQLQNPNFFISRTRVSVRNLPKTVDENALRAALNNIQELQSKKNPIKKVIIMRERQQGRRFGRSKGYAFVEFHQHADALCAVRGLHANCFAETARSPIIEFVVEDSRSMHIKSLKQEAQRRFAQKKKSLVEPMNEPVESKKRRKQGPRKKFREGEESQVKNQGEKRKRSLKGKKSTFPNPSNKKVRRSKSKDEVEIDFEGISTEKKTSRRKKKETKDHFEQMVESYKKKFFAD